MAADWLAYGGNPHAGRSKNAASGNTEVVHHLDHHLVEVPDPVVVEKDQNTRRVLRRSGKLLVVKRNAHDRKKKIPRSEENYHAVASSRCSCTSQLPSLLHGVALQQPFAFSQLLADINLLHTPAISTTSLLVCPMKSHHDPRLPRRYSGSHY
ncbi:unnamed protein product [Amoebophrya sp. A25]|nr:unnamed protein product [Amoebophrya sp. A25]|eukprot:GSA25T00012790001.1